MLWEWVALLLGATVGKQADANPPSCGYNVTRTNAIPGCLKRSVGIGTGLTFIYEEDKTDLEFLLFFNTVNAHLSKAMMKKSGKMQKRATKMI